MNHRKIVTMAAAIFAIGAAFGAQPTSLQADRPTADLGQREPWVPGANMLMSAHEAGIAPVAPPR